MTTPALDGRRLARLGLLVAIVSRLVGRSIGIILVVLLAREADDETVAVYGYLLGTASLMAVLTDSGVGTVVAREVAAGRLPARAALFAALLPQACSVAVACVLTWGLAVLTGPVAIPTSALVLTVVFVVFTGFVSLWAEMLRATGRVVAEGALQMGGAVALVAAGVAVIHGGGDATLLLLAVALKEGGLLATSVMMLRPRRERDVRIRELLGQSLWLAVAAAGLVVLWRQGMLVLGATASIGALAAYVVATRLLDAGVVVAQSAAVGLAPGMSALSPDQQAFGRTARRYLGLAAVAGLLVAAAGTLLAQPITTTVFGSRWEEAAPAVAVVALTGLPVLVAHTAWPLLLARRQMRWLAMSALAGTSTGIAVSIGLVAWRPDALSAVIGTAVGATVLVSVQLVGLRDVLATAPHAGREPSRSDVLEPCHSDPAST